MSRHHSFAAAFAGLCLFCFCASFTAHAALVRTTVPYSLDGVTMQGYLVYDDDNDGKRPGVLVIHEWWGLNDYAKKRADELAAMGYVAFAADMYGDGKVATTREEAGKLVGTVRGTPLMATRARAALDTLAAQPQTDPEELAVIGFCFGGTAALELAFSGAPLKGAVSFHGGLVELKPEAAPKMQAKLLICHGAIDPNVPQDTVIACVKSLEAAHVDYQFIAYSGAVHAFTNPASGDDISKGVAYNANAARRSWAAMQTFFDEIF